MVEPLLSMGKSGDLIHNTKSNEKRKGMGMGYSSEIHHLPDRCWSLALNPVLSQNKQTKRKGREGKGNVLLKIF